MKSKENEKLLIGENQFLMKQIKEARKQNRLLKIAISKLQNDFERVVRETKHPIEINYSLLENDKDNILQKLDRIMNQNASEEFSTEKVLDKLEDVEKTMKNIAEEKTNDYQDFSHEEGLRKKLTEEFQRIQNQSHGDVRYGF